MAALKKKKITPTMAVILVGEDKPSQTYVRRKHLAAERVGIKSLIYNLPATISMKKLIDKIEDIQHSQKLSGLIVQLPLPEKLYAGSVLNTIHPEIDIDCLTDVNLGKLVMKTNYLVPPTPGAVITILKELEVELGGKNVTIIGMGALVGKPLAIMLINEGSSVTTCNSRTKDITSKCLAADIIITGVGKKDILRGNMIKPGAIVIDTGVAFVDGKMYGDVNVDEALAVASHVTPTPGGVGPLTVARLLLNTVICAERNAKLKPQKRIKEKYLGEPKFTYNIKQI